MKAVLMVYPIKQYVQRSEPLHCRAFGLDERVKFWGKTLQVPEARIYRRFKLVNKLLDEYRRDSRIYWIFFGDRNNKIRPVIRDKASLYQINPDDAILSAGVTYDELNFESKYPNHESIIDKIPKLTEAVVGGFHASDCVKRYSLALGNLDVPNKIDNWLTDIGLVGFEETLGQDLYAKMIASGHLDAKMHEDDPEEMKMIITNDRFTKEDLKL